MPRTPKNQLQAGGRYSTVLMPAGQPCSSLAGTSSSLLVGSSSMLQTTGHAACTVYVTVPDCSMQAPDQAVGSPQDGTVGVARWRPPSIHL